MKIGLISDAHGCIEGFDQALAILEGMSVDEIHFLGDAIGYFPGLAVVDRLLTTGIPAVMGNHERMALDGSYAGKDHIYKLGQTMEQARGHHREFMQTLPTVRILNSPLGRIELMHGSPVDRISGYLYPDADLSRIDSDDVAFFCMGHTHRPFVKTAGDCVFVNVGSCSMPRDGGMLGCVCVLDTVKGCAQLFRYDLSDAFRRAMVRCGDVAHVVKELLKGPSYNHPVGTLLS